MGKESDESRLDLYKYLRLVDEDKRDKRLEQALQNAREKYFRKHGRWPEEDGIEIWVNI
jgi:hypothetical protein